MTTARHQRSAARTLQRREAWRRFRRSRPGMLGVALLGAFVIMAVAYPLLMRTVWDPARYDPEIGIDFVVTEKAVVVEVTDPATQMGITEAMLRDPFAVPGDVIEISTPAGFGWSHLLGTDPTGRDVLAMVLAGTGPTLMVAISAALTTAIVAIGIAVFAAYYRGVVDGVLAQVSDALLLLPAPLLMIIIGTSPIGDHFSPIMFGVVYGLIAGGGAAAIVLRSQALITMQRQFVEAARAAGAGGRRIMFTHLLPHLIPLAAVSMLIGVTGAIVADGFVAFLSFSPTRFNWGTMLSFAMAFPGPGGLVDTPWNVLVAGGIAISLLAASFYFVAIGVQAATENSSRTPMQGSGVRPNRIRAVRTPDS